MAESILYKKLMKIKEKMLNECTVCNHKGEIELKTCKCMEKFKFYTQMAYSGIEKEYWDLELNDWHGETKIKDVIKNYLLKIDKIIEEGISFGFSGFTGTGKTFLACLFLKEALRKNYKVYKITLEKFLNMIKEGFDNPDKLTDLDKIETVDIFLLDEIGGEYTPANFGVFCSAKCDDLFRTRKSNMLSTIITTNLEKAEFQKLYGSKIESITNAYIWNAVSGPDYRQVQLNRMKEDLLNEL